MYSENKGAEMDKNFTKYMLDFYGTGPEAIYQYGFTVEQIEAATKLYKTQLMSREQEFCGDSVDREYVRDIVLEIYYPELV
jgi:hypothetical protein